MGSVVTAAAVLVAVCATGGCENGGTVTADCQSQIRVGEAVFTSNGYTERNATKQGVADQAECHDVGDHAAGSVFPDHPLRVQTWRFDGYSPAQVLGVRHGEDGFAIYVVDHLPQDERDRILTALSHPEP